MAKMPDPGTEVTGGVDTHKDFHVAAAVDQLGRVLATAAFPARRSGYRRLLGRLSSFGPVGRVGVEGTGAWGAGLCRYLTEAEVEVCEVVRPNRQHRRRYGKSDVTDAIAAARAVLSGEASGKPRGGTGPVESIRLLKIARRSAIRARTAAANQLHAVIVTCPEEIRRPLLSLPIAKIIGLVDAYRQQGLTKPEIIRCLKRYVARDIYHILTHPQPAP